MQPACLWSKIEVRFQRKLMFRERKGALWNPNPFNFKGRKLPWKIIQSSSIFNDVIFKVFSSMLEQISLSTSEPTSGARDHSFLAINQSNLAILFSMLCKCWGHFRAFLSRWWKWSSNSYWFHCRIYYTWWNKRPCFEEHSRKLTQRLREKAGSAARVCVVIK